LTINNGRCFVEVEGYNGSEKEIEEKWWRWFGGA
jgi:hypothetical protein